MRNLAGDPEADRIVQQELKNSQIEIIHHAEILNDQVPTHFNGVLKKNGRIVITFFRFWSYWQTRGLVPLNVALELYADPVAKLDIVVPELYENRLPEGVANGIIGAHIDSYHILREEGLRFFVATLRRHNLVD